jgi:glycosyltransferase involved in cell wall biosynthesis
MANFQSLVLSRFRPDKPAGGAALKNWQNISALAALGPVDVISIGEESESAAVPNVRSWTPFSFSALQRSRTSLENWKLRLWPFARAVHPAINCYHHVKVRDCIRSLASKHAYKVALVEELSLVPYISDLRACGCKVIYDAHNVESPLRSSLERAQKAVDAKPALTGLKQRLLGRNLEIIERNAVQGADLVWACSEKDAGLLQQLYNPRSEVAVVPNGVNPDDYFDPAAISPDADWSDHPLRLVFMGSFMYYPNEEAALILARKVLPVLRSRGYKPKAVLVGRAPSPAMRAAAEEDPDVIVTGQVPSILPYLAAPGIVTLPITLGSGTRLKIVEAFAACRPVISTSKGAEGIDVVDGQNLLLRETPEAIAEGVIELWRNRELRTKMCRNALDLIHSRYSWAAASKSIYKSLGVRLSELEPVLQTAF